MVADAGTALRVVESDVPGPIVLHGGPGRLRGEIHLANDTDERVTATEPTITATAGGPTAIAVSSRAGSIAPGRVRRVAYGLRWIR